jgi:hypothetical protein
MTEEMETNMFQMHERSCRRRKLPGSMTLTPLLWRLRWDRRELVNENPLQIHSWNSFGILSILLIEVSMILFRRDFCSSTHDLALSRATSTDDAFLESSTTQIQTPHCNKCNHQQRVEWPWERCMADCVSTRCYGSYAVIDIVGKNRIV